LSSVSTRFILGRAINAILTLLLLILIVFVLIHIIAPDPIDLARLYAPNPHVPLSSLQVIVREYGLDQPLPVQLINYVSNVLHGNFGTDTLYAVPELQVLEQFLPITLEIVFLGQLLGVIIGIFTGSIAAASKGGVRDYAVKAFYLSTWSIPTFLAAFLFQLILAYGLGLLPAGGIADPLLIPPPAVTNFPLIDALLAGNWAYFWSVAQHLVLPVITIALIGFGTVTRLTRSSMLGALNKDYVKLAYMKGQTKNKVVYGTAFRNAVIPIVTIVAVGFGVSVGGSIIVEYIFQYHGIGYFIYQSTINLDYVAILGFTIVLGTFVILANFIADLLYAYLDPRVRLT